MKKEDMYLVVEDVWMDNSHYDEFHISIDEIINVKENHDRMVNMYRNNSAFKKWLDDIIVDIPDDCID